MGIIAEENRVRGGQRPDRFELRRFVLIPVIAVMYEQVDKPPPQSLREYIRGGADLELVPGPDELRNKPADLVADVKRHKSPI